MNRLVVREDRDGLATLTLNRPDKLNALNVALFAELEAHLATLETQTDRVGLVLLRGAGRAFCAGNDLAGIAAGDAPPRANFQSQVVERLASVPQPVVTAVHGACFTGGLELALAGDMIVAAESARFADTHAKWGLTPIWGMSQRLPRRVGRAKAQEMMLTCRTYTGAEALAIDLVNMCVPDADFDVTLAELAAGILANSWHSHRGNKALLRETDGMELAAGLAHEVFRTVGIAPDAKERIASFTGKKKA